MQKSQSPRALERILHRFVAMVLDQGLARVLRGHLPEAVFQLLQGSSLGSKERLGKLLTSIVLPDLMPILLSMNAQLRSDSMISVVAPPRFGCSSFFCGSNGSLMHGRNLDFPGVGYWDRYPVIQMTDTGKGMRYIGFTTAGVPVCGITGVNEEQISVSLHQHYCRNYSFGGVPPFVIGERILANARTADDALRILKDSRVSAAWAFLIGDGKSNRAFIYECHPYQSGVLWMHEHGGVIAHSNYFQSPECSPSGYAASARMNWDNAARKTRLEANVRCSGASPENATRFLSEHVDGVYNLEKMINRTVSQVYNVSSVVLDLARMVAWMAEGDSPIHLRHYAEFDLGEVFAGRDGRTGAELKPYRFENESVRRAKELYILSFVSAFDGDEKTALARALDSLESSVSTEGAMVAGVLSMKSGELDQAHDLLRRAISHSENIAPRPPEYFEACLFLARVLDLQGNRQAASEFYRRVANTEECADDHLKRLALEKRPYRKDRMHRILTPFSSYVPFE